MNDIERSRELKTEEEKRLAFFKRWKKEKGFEASYGALVTALLKIKNREDAEKICALLKNSPTSNESHHSEMESTNDAPDATG